MSATAFTVIHEFLIICHNRTRSFSWTDVEKLHGCRECALLQHTDFVEHGQVSNMVLNAALPRKTEQEKEDNAARRLYEQTLEVSLSWPVALATSHNVKHCLLCCCIIRTQ